VVTFILDGDPTAATKKVSDRLLQRRKPKELAVIAYAGVMIET